MTGERFRAEAIYQLALLRLRSAEANGEVTDSVFALAERLLREKYRPVYADFGRDVGGKADEDRHADPR